MIKVGPKLSKMFSRSLRKKLRLEFKKKAKKYPNFHQIQKEKFKSLLRKLKSKHKILNKRPKSKNIHLSS